MVFSLFFACLFVILQPIKDIRTHEETIMRVYRAVAGCPDDSDTPRQGTAQGGHDEGH